MGKRFQDKVVIVTGASSGIGKATAIAFGKEGAKLALSARRVDECETTAAAVCDAGGEAVVIRMDVTNDGDIRNMVAETVNAFGRIHCAFNNVGIAGETGIPTHEHSKENWDQVISVNLTSVLLSMKYEIAEMLKTGGGTIVNNSSIYGLVGSTIGHVPYVASKYGIIGVTQTAAFEYAEKNIRVNAVCPGFTRTERMQELYEQDPDRVNDRILPRIPMGRLGEMDEIARVVLWLASEEASYVTGQAVAADGGWIAI
ncbi:MAG: glucose 1-dehydrogenase [Planctomycetes bacterium]|nr:glucose 1-dehydrogenase [Planctomycetota bacterium]